jgi:YegS/Rv2252/BmrU family lipid kinase
MSDVYLLNPRAGRGLHGDVRSALAARLRSRGLDENIQLTDDAGHAVELARAAALSGAERVIAVGGDGTAHEVVNGVAGTDAAFGLLPTGTGNDLALALGIPGDLDGALDVLVDDARSRIDLGRFNDGWFVNSLGLGFEAQVTIESTKIRGLKGFAVYLAAVVKALGGLHCPDLELSIDGRRLDGRRLLACVGNGPRVGGGFYLTPDAVNDDGLLDLCLVNAMGRLAVLRTLPKALKGTHTRDRRVEMHRGKVLRIRSVDGFPFHADGEVKDTARHELDIEIHPASLPVVVPASRSHPPKDDAP